MQKLHQSIPLFHQLLHYLWEAMVSTVVQTKEGLSGGNNIMIETGMFRQQQTMLDLIQPYQILVEIKMDTQEVYGHLAKNQLYISRLKFLVEMWELLDYQHLQSWGLTTV